ncbi:hypothetical protein C8R42DRAFT_369037 [Lentinula raphanica]|nr:hypothetical protein C8R42DRAFT_369037 [Lentinula raphanica]
MALGRFSSLRTLSLHGVFKLLNFKSNTSLPPVRRVNPKDAFDAVLARAETGILLFASRVAREVRSLETIYVKDKGYENPTYSIGKFWRLVGWLHITNSSRDVVGTLRRAANEACLNSEVSLVTGMLPSGFITQS